MMSQTERKKIWVSIETDQKSVYFELNTSVPYFPLFAIGEMRVRNSYFNLGLNVILILATGRKENL